MSPTFEQVIASLDRPPVLIGHSMSGLVVQKIMHRQFVPAAVLMASAPPHGMIPSMFGMAFTNPGLFREMALVQAFGPEIVNGLNVRQALFCDDTPDEDVIRYMHRFQAESTLIVLDLMGLDLPPSTPSLDLPVLVLGAADDCFVFPGAIAATAETYRTEAEIFTGMAHAMMLDHNWRKVADRIAGWLPTALAGRPVAARDAATASSA